MKTIIHTPDLKIKDKGKYRPMDRFEMMLMRLPFACDWVFFDGEDCVAQYNYEATKKAGKPMVDISYCMTKALNQNIERTVQWDKNKFKPSRLGDSEW